MATMEVSAKTAKEGGKMFKGTIEVPGDTQGMIDAYGAQAVYDNAWASFKITIQSAIRRLAEAGKSDSEIQTVISGMKMGVSLPRTASAKTELTVEKAKNLLLQSVGTLSAEDRAALIAAIKAANRS